MVLDGQLFMACHQHGVEKVVYSSSGCVYPNRVQTNVQEKLFLHEDLVQPPYDSDNLYGWAKLMGELTLQAYHKQHGLKVAICRYFTAYGPRAVENHAVIALIARAFIRADPFEVWGTGEQIRNWTYIDDIVAGTLAAAERIHDGTPVNLGTMERVSVFDAAKQILALTNHRAEIVTLPHMPTGPLNRVADNHRAANLLGWEPKVPFAEGLRRTIDWYFGSKNLHEVRSFLDRVLTERGNLSLM
jgi:nucleoside-diphosphate-sugar epimerase